MRSFSKKCIFGLILMLCIEHIAIAQNNQIRSYTIEDGLPQSQVYEVAQDSVGYIWLGTQGGGIARFDGNQFKIWNEKKGLISNYIHSISFINDSVFIGTKYGLSIKVKTHFSNFKTPQINKIISHNSTVYLATSLGCYSFNSRHKINRLNITTLIDNSIINDIVYRNNWFWIATNNGLWKVDQHFNTKIKISDFNFTSIAFYKEKAFCASFSKGILAVDINSNISSVINKIKRINSLTIINDDELWISTDNTGITVINSNDYAVVQKIDKNNGLSISHIRKCFEDKQSNIWAASSGGGLFKISENNFKHYDKDTGLKGNRIYAIENVNDAIWFSNSEEGLMKIDSIGIHQIKQDAGYLNVKVKSLAHDSNGTIFAGTNGKGILVLHNSVRDSLITTTIDENTVFKDTLHLQNAFTDTLDVKNGFPFDWIRKIHIQDHTIWTASYSGGIASFEYEIEERSIRNLKTFGIHDGIQDIYINDIASDKGGKLWYGTKNGELGYLENDHVSHLGNLLGEITSIRTILFHNNQIFIGTSGKGIWWSNLSEPLFFNRLIGQKELYSDNIYQIIFDNTNQLWAGSESGIDKISLTQNNEIIEVIHYGRNDGFLGIETCLNSVVKDFKGDLWFGAINGLTKYQHTTIEQQKTSPTIHFEEIESMNRSIDSLPLSSQLNSHTTLQLKPHQNLLTFHYKTIDINNPKEIAYRWKIDDSNWSTWSSDTKINVASDYGSHTFIAQSRNLGWQLSEPISFSFFIEIPLYKKPWFRWLLSAIIVLGITSIVWLYFKRLKTKNKEEKEHLQLQNHLLSLEQKALQLQMNPHFIFNVLNGIKAMSLDDTTTMHTTINKFATLLRATLTNSRCNTITLHQEILTLENYLEIEQLMSEKKFTYTINTNTNIDLEEILIPPMLIQPFVENAVRHGIMAVKREGALSINFTTTEKFILCEITDNGIGIHHSKQRNTNTSHQSMALEVTKERIAHLSGHNTLIITELTDVNNKPNGTCISFNIPLQTDY